MFMIHWKQSGGGILARRKWYPGIHKFLFKPQFWIKSLEGEKRDINMAIDQWFSDKLNLVFSTIKKRYSHRTGSSYLERNWKLFWRRSSYCGSLSLKFLWKWRAFKVMDARVKNPTAAGKRRKAFGGCRRINISVVNRWTQGFDRLTCYRSKTSICAWNDLLEEQSSTTAEGDHSWHRWTWHINIKRNRQDVDYLSWSSRCAIQVLVSSEGGVSSSGRRTELGKCSAIVASLTFRYHWSRISVIKVSVKKSQERFRVTFVWKNNQLRYGKTVNQATSMNLYHIRDSD